MAYILNVKNPYAAHTAHKKRMNELRQEVGYKTADEIIQEAETKRGVFFIGSTQIDKYEANSILKKGYTVLFTRDTKTAFQRLEWDYLGNDGNIFKARNDYGIEIEIQVIHVNDGILIKQILNQIIYEHNNK